MSEQSSKERLKLCLEVIGAVVGLATILFGVYSFHSNNLAEQKNDQVKQSLSYISEFSKGYGKDRGELLLDVRRVVNAEDDKKKQLVEELMKDENYLLRAWRIITFYENLYLCIDTQLCDKEVALNYFHEAISEDYTYLFAYIESERKRYKKANDEESSFAMSFKKLYSLAKGYSPQK